MYGLGLLFSARNRPPAVTGRAERNGEMAPPKISPARIAFATNALRHRTLHRSDYIHNAYAARKPLAAAARLRSVADVVRSGEQ